MTLAHFIRHPTTNFYRTCRDLEARSRWCLSGTPIQNRLQDIGALFAFIRADPFHNIAQFRKFIVMPFNQGDAVVKDRLVMLYDSLCLRRTKDILTLPGFDEKLSILEFTPKERNHYDRTLSIVKRSMQEKVNQYEQVSKFGLFQAQLQLRILCNHGTYQKPFSWKRNRLRETKESLMVELGTGLEVKCGCCEHPRPLLISRETSNVQSCGHYFCQDCLDDSGAMTMSPDSTQCPLCPHGDNAPQPQHVRTPIISSIDVAGMGQSQPQQAKSSNRDDYFNDVGFSVKMRALVQDVRKDLDHMKRSNSLRP